MASPPFTISNSIPADNDIVSQFPGVDRGLRDVVNSWLLVDHNNNPGGHNQVTLAQQADPAGVASATRVSARTDGTLIKLVGNSNPAEYVGVPPGMMMPGAMASPPQGWLFANGQAISRTTYATLFAAIGVTFGVGDGSTTFNVPDTRNRSVLGVDAMGGTSATNRITVAGGNTDGTVIAGTGGLQNHTMTLAELVAHTHIATVTDPGHLHSLLTYNGGGAGGTFNAFLQALSQNNALNSQTATTGISVANASVGSTTPFTIMNPYLLMNWFIKY